jgi:metallo-beta-lactamase class B
MKMKFVAIRVGIALVLAASAAVAQAQDSPPTIDGLLSAAKNAAGLEWAGTFLRLCIVPGPAASQQAGRPTRETWYAEPAKVADNLYFLGTRIHNAWAITGSVGIIILEALYDYAAPDEIIAA